jgi:hypothetical protein
VLVSTDRIDPEVIMAAKVALRVFDARYTKASEEERLKIAISAADEKRRELAGPEGQRYAYRVCCRHLTAESWYRSEADARYWAEKFLRREWWLERALLGDWERVG